MDDDAIDKIAKIVRLPLPRTYPATPFDPAHLASLQPRQWVYGHFLIRQYLSLLGGAGGVGKTSYAIAIALSVVLEEPLVAERVAQGGAVWLINLEDGLDEMERRIWASCLLHGIDPLHLAGKLYTDTGREKPLVLVRHGDDGAAHVEPVFDALLAELLARQVVLLIIDPAIKSHRVRENSNEDMDVVAEQWTRLAAAANCSVLLLQHFRKGAGQPNDQDSFRGASALVDAARSAIAMSVMTADEAKAFNIPESDRRAYIRADNAKLNLAPQPSEAVWLRLESVELPTGDFVQAAKRWQPTSPWDGIPMVTACQILRAIAAGPAHGEMFTASRRGRSNDRWAGTVICSQTAKSPEQAAIILKEWLSSQLLTETTYHSNSARKDLTGLVLDEKRVSEMEQQIKAHDPAAQFDAQLDE